VNVRAVHHPRPLRRATRRPDDCHTLPVEHRRPPGLPRPMDRSRDRRPIMSSGRIDGKIARRDEERRHL
jgi:hypothetical protein